MIRTTMVALLLAVVPTTTLGAQVRGMGSGAVIAKIQLVVDQAEATGNEVVRVEADLIRSEQVTFRSMQSGYTYGVVVVGSNRVQDIDVEIHRQVGDTWVLVAKDDDTSAVAAVTVAPSTTGVYRVTTRVYRFKSGYDVGHYGLIVFHN